MFRTCLASSGGLLLKALRRCEIALVLAVSLGISAPAMSRPPSPPETPAVVELAALPAEAQMTFRLIRRGGPFPYSKDGIVFGNRERVLPIKPRGYYHEYTVRTPGARNRGARRIVCGGAQPKVPDTCYYTENHYASFRRIVPAVSAP